MRKSDIFNAILDKVCEECEVRRDCVLKNVKLQAVVDARMLAVQYMRRAGLSNDDIALIVLRMNAGDMGACPPINELRMKSKGIDKMFRSYSDRCMQTRAFCLMSKDLADYFRTQYEVLVDGFSRT